MAQQPLVGQGLLIIESSWSHSHTPHSVGLLWTNDQPVAETSWLHTTLTRDIHATGGIRTHNPSKRVAADPPRGHWDRLTSVLQDSHATVQVGSQRPLTAKRSSLGPKVVRVGLLVDKVAAGLFSPRTSISSISIIPPMLCNLTAFTYHRRYIILATDSVVKYSLSLLDNKTYHGSAHQNDCVTTHCPSTK